MSSSRGFGKALADVRWAAAALTLLSGGALVGELVSLLLLGVVSRTLLPAAVFHFACSVPRALPLLRFFPTVVMLPYLLCLIAAAFAARTVERLPEAHQAVEALGSLLFVAAWLILVARLLRAFRERATPDRRFLLSLAAALLSLVGFAAWRWASGGALAAAAAFASLPAAAAPWVLTGQARLAHTPAARARFPGAEAAPLGEVARRIAHSILKPVTAVSEQLRLLAPTLADPAARADLENAAQLMGQVQRLVRDLLDLARAQGVPDRRRLDLRSLLEHAVLGFRSRFPEAHVELTADDGHLVADEVGMGCLLGNLLDNAAEADPPGWIRVVARHWAPSVEISIEDRSGGLAREVRERLFEPFVTTKPRGTGLGLAVAREVCRSHGGHLEALPTDRGTRFVVTLPLEGD